MLVDTGADGISVAMATHFDYASDGYADLFRRSRATAFQHPIWLDALFRHLAPARQARNASVVIHQHGRMVGLLPLILRRKSGVTLLESADLGVSDYAAPVLDKEWKAPADLASLVADALPAHDILRIRPVRDDTVDQWLMCLGGEAQKLDFASHASLLAGTYEDWRHKALDASFARYLDKKKKRVLKGGAQLRLLADPAEIRDAIDAIRVLRAGRFEGDPIQQDFCRDFYTQAAVKGALAGFARTYSLMLNGEALGHVFGLTWNGRFHYLLIGCDYQRHGRHSPGLVLYDMMIEDWMRDGGAVFDFTIGDEAFKKDFGTTATGMHLVGARPTWRGQLANVAFEARALLRGLRRSEKAE